MHLVVEHDAGIRHREGAAVARLPLEGLREAAGENAPDAVGVQLQRPADTLHELARALGERERKSGR